MSDPLERLKATREAENGSEVVTRYGVGVVAFEERLNGYVIRYEAETVPQLLDLMYEIDAKRQRDKAARGAEKMTYPEAVRRANAVAIGDGVLASEYLAVVRESGG